MTMQRRTFLQIVGAASITPTALDAGPLVPAATVLYDDRATPLSTVRRSPSDPAALWVRKRDLPRINDFILQHRLGPWIARRLETCTLVAATYGVEYEWPLLDARLVQQYLSTPSIEKADRMGARYLHRRAVEGVVPAKVAWKAGKPDVTVPDRHGRPVHLAHFRGKKVLLVTWASW